MSHQNHDNEQGPTIYSQEAIEMLLDGSRRQIDGLMLRGLNDLAKAFIDFRNNEFRPHVKEEEAMKEALGTPEEVERRRRWLDLQIKKEEACANIRYKIMESTLTKYVPIIIVAIALAATTGVVDKAYDWWISWKIFHHTKGA